MEADLNRPWGEGYRSLSLWWDRLPGPIEVRPPLPGDLDVDVAVVGGGLTGLWTAFYLAEADPSLRIAVLERDVVGFGASGRNGGWCSALFAASEATLDRASGPGSGEAMRLAMQATVPEVGRVVAAEGIACGFARGGTVVLARTGGPLPRTRDEVAAARARGIDEGDLKLLSAAEASARVGAAGVLGGTYTPHCAAVDPARLVRGLAEAVERRGVPSTNRRGARAIGRGSSRRGEERSRAASVIRATEGYTRTLLGEGRRWSPCTR